ncbi:ubiquitin-related domain-containing protein [Hyaloscypha finlandica]|nr:ubiquitin-related domain-containing protein [Hyaloscypha finlandica]
MAEATPKTTGAGHASTPSNASSSAQPPSKTLNQPPIELSDFEPSGRTATGAGSQGPLSYVSIPTTSPISSFLSVLPSSTMSESAATANTASENTKPEQESSWTSNAAVSSQSRRDPLSIENTAQTASASVSAAEPSSSSTPAPAIQRLDSVAIGPSIDVDPKLVTSDAGPVLLITLLLTSGARHPYKLDEKYLTKRNVVVPALTEGGRKDPYSISVYTLKELILREWREEWETQPSSPSSIRLIYFGRLLDDKTPLKECRFNTESANVVHMTVRPQDIVDEEDASKSKALARGREGAEGTAGCRCVIL